MDYGAITFMPGESILGKKMIVVEHLSISNNFGNNRGGGNRQTKRIAPN
jgi:hypothetical protein